ncbi:ankyrin repeat and SAM domain containing protein 6 [Colletotrichum scovillei]|nr:ankyrin repeat and SAM domain containing protein 6 [Colletotrichum scovillei]
MAQLQEMIPKLAAIALERLVFSGAGPAEVQTLVQRQNSTIWLSEAFITYAWCTQKGLFDYFRSKPNRHTGEHLRKNNQKADI